MADDRVLTAEQDFQMSPLIVGIVLVIIILFAGLLIFSMTFLISRVGGKSSVRKNDLVESLVQKENILEVMKDLCGEKLVEYKEKIQSFCTKKTGQCLLTDLTESKLVELNNFSEESISYCVKKQSQ